MIEINDTNVTPICDSGRYTGAFQITNTYLTSNWFPMTNKIWDELSIEIAILLEIKIKKHLKTEMNKEAYNKLYPENKK